LDVSVFYTVFIIIDTKHLAYTTEKGTKKVS
jgi:hypothetical protein